MMMSVKPISTTGQYMYMELIHEKLSHMKRPIRKMKKDGIWMTLRIKLCQSAQTSTYLEQLAPL
jgi:hypothetical protein